MSCDVCTKLFSIDSLSGKLARDAEEQAPGCQCEAMAVSLSSIGRIQDEEIVFRAFVDPADVDEQTGDVSADAFRSAHESGLSVFRDSSTNEEISNLIIDILSVKEGRPFKKIICLFKARCVDIRSIWHPMPIVDPRQFCIYDQLVPRVFDSEAEPVRTHGIVLSRLLNPHKDVKRKLHKDIQLDIRRLFISERVPVDEFRDGLIARLNERSLAGDFIRF
ncbi:hypothetical protein [Xanthobacter sp. 126]|uniref:hypothetical protein n=1 Tax=Xanthobacter sp. 126 TaxID=1131814 RepID=UPI0012DFACDB|nr:hypothetical protein [Xanthobacter sp. 126]